MSEKCNSHRIKGFTLLEILLTISILGIITAVALPSISEVIVKTRVDNEVSALHRLILNARNAAVNTGKNVTVCPLTANVCTGNWQAEISVFTNDSNLLADNQVYNNDGNENNNSADEKLIKIKSAVLSTDTLNFDANLIIFSPTGRAVAGGNSTFTFCPADNDTLGRSLFISLSGRVYTSTDANNNGIDEDRNNAEISCS